MKHSIGNYRVAILMHTDLRLSMSVKYEGAGAAYSLF